VEKVKLISKNKQGIALGVGDDMPPINGSMTVAIIVADLHPSAVYTSLVAKLQEASMPIA